MSTYKTTTSIQSIIVPIDFSDISIHALEAALVIGAMNEAHITLVHVIHIPSISMVGQYEVYPLEAASINHEKQAATSALTNLQHKYQQSYPFPIHQIIEEGVISEKINAIGSEIKADLIVMGASGASEIKKLILGSNAFAVLKSASCPVLTMPASSNWERIHTILFPVRNVPGVVRKGEYLQQLIPSGNIEVHLLGLYEDDNDLNQLNDNLHQMEYWMKEAGNQTTISKVTTTSPAKEVQRVADEIEADLIVINATLDYSLSDYFLGPYSERIVNHANVPVLSIRSAKAANQTITFRNIPELEERIGQMAMYSKPYIEHD
jgi:nucleotide-binding universal stress UspA family protein